MAAVGGEAPAFAPVGELALQFEVLQPPDEADFRLPGELHDAVAEHGDAFAEEVSGEGELLENDAGFELHLAQSRAAVQAGAFVEEAVAVFQTLGEGFPVVGIGVDDLVGPLAREGAGEQE